MSSSYTHSLYIGRFQPFHSGHAQMLRHALALAPRCIVVLGSAHHAPTPRNPWDWQIRAEMIRASLDPQDAARVSFLPLRDYFDSDRWAAELRHAVALQVAEDAVDRPRIALITHFKDASSAYLKWFPEWETVAFERQNDIDATPLRQTVYQALLDGESAAQALARVSAALPQGTLQVLAGQSEWGHRTMTTASEMAAEWQTLQASLRAWQGSPYPPIFVTTDCVLVCGGHVLLVERDRRPGAGLMALPGGFVEADERLLPAALRELHEETGLNLDLSRPDVSLREVRVFDHPQRSERGRVITHVHVFDLHADHLPAVQGGDDARRAEWVPLTALASLEPRLHDDHFHILDSVLHVLPSRAQR